MMTCQDFQENLVDLAYGTMDLVWHQKAMQHCEECSSCSGEWLRVTQVRQAFQQLPQYEPSPWVLQQVLKESRLAKTPSGWWASFIEKIMVGARFWQLAPMVVVLFMMVGVGYVTHQHSKTKGGGPVVASSPYFDTMASSPYFDTMASSLTQSVFGDNTADSFSLRDRLLQNPFGAQDFPRGFLGASDNQPFFKNVAVDDSTNMPVGLWSHNNLLDRNSNPQEDARYQLFLESDADALLMRGRRLKAMGRVDLALQDFDAIYYNYPNYTYIGDVLMYRAQCYAFQGQYDKAIESLDVFVQKDPSKTSLVKPLIDQIRTSQQESQFNK